MTDLPLTYLVDDEAFVDGEEPIDGSLLLVDGEGAPELSPSDGGIELAPSLDLLLGAQGSGGDAELVLEPPSEAASAVVTAGEEGFHSGIVVADLPDPVVHLGAELDVCVGPETDVPETVDGVDHYSAVGDVFEDTHGVLGCFLSLLDDVGYGGGDRI